MIQLEKHVIQGINKLTEGFVHSSMCTIGVLYLGSYYDVGGGLHEETGFRGCLRDLVIDGKLRYAGYSLTSPLLTVRKISPFI